MTRFRMTTVSLAMLILPAAVIAGDPELEKLKQGLQSPQESVRVETIRTLKVTGAESSRTADLLVPLLGDSSAQVQQAASAALVKLGKNALPALTQALSSKDWQTRRTASSVLAKLGSTALSSLIEVVEKDPVPLARAEAILALETIGEGAKDAIKPLVEVVRNSEDFQLRKAAIQALAKMNPEAGAGLLDALKGANVTVRFMIISTLSVEQAGIAKKTLLKLLRDPAEEIRLASAKALAKLGIAIVEDVQPLLQDNEVGVRAAAIHAIESYEDAGKLGNLLKNETMSEVHEALATALARKGSSAFSTLADALRSKDFRVEKTATEAILLMEERADDLIPILVESLLSKHTDDPELMARAILGVNPIYGARELAQKARPEELAGILKKQAPTLQELTCMALAEQGGAPDEVVRLLSGLVQNESTEVNVLAAAVRALSVLAPRDFTLKRFPDLLPRIVQGTHKKSRVQRTEGMHNLLGIGLKTETFEAILAMVALDIDADEARDWIIYHANASRAWHFAGPNLVRVLALFGSRSKLGPHRLNPGAEDALKAHLWRYVQQPPGKGPGIPPNPVPEVSAVLPIDYLPWSISAYLALDLLKDDPQYQNEKVQGRTLQEHYQDWTVWWRDWAKYRALHGLWSEMGFTLHQAFIWPNLLNMVDLASDPVVKQRFRMLLDLTMIEEEQISMQGVRVGRRGSKDQVGGNLDPWKDLFFGEHPRRFSGANVNYRGIYWTTTYKLPTAAILLRKLKRPVTHYAMTNHHFYGGSVFGFAAPHYLLGCQFSKEKTTTEFPGVWHRMVFDDMNGIFFPLTGGTRHHMQHRSIYMARLAGSEAATIDFTAALKTVERDGWIFLSNGPAFAAIHLSGGYRLSRLGRVELGRHNCDSIIAKTTDAFLVLQGGDVQTFGSFEKFQGAILTAPLKVTEDSMLYTGPNMPAIEFFREPTRPTIIDGVPQSLRSETKCYDSPYLQGEVGQARITVRFGPYSAIYDFDSNSVTEVTEK